MPRRGLLILGVVVGVLVLVAAALYLLRIQSEARQPPREAAESGRASPAVPSPSVAVVVGSGRVVRGDWYEVAFTGPIYPDDPARHHGGLDERLVALVDRAQKTLDVADYDFDLPNVADAMVRASERRVRVRMVTDTDTLDNTRDADIQAAFDKLKEAGIPVVDDQRQDIMHHKFIVVDGEWVETGSWNYTDGDTYRLNNSQFVVRSPELAANYTAEFEKMFVQRKFGPSKPRGVPNPRLTIRGARVENLFAPEDGVSERLVDLVRRETRRSVRFMAFSFTLNPLGDAMIAQAKNGLSVQGVFETTGSNTPHSEYGRMKEAGLDVYQDGNPYVMHHKVIVIDGRTTIFGSFNFSSNAAEDNDENILFVDDPTLAASFLAEVERVVAQAKRP
jgi:phosphatidylserine/phosphatidylglycerophosphate/cardiolipin synthase-like enzyme